MPEQDHLTPEERDALVAIRARKTKLVSEHRRKKSVANTQAVLPRRGERERTSNVTTMKVRCGRGRPPGFRGRRPLIGQRRPSSLPIMFTICNVLFVLHPLYLILEITHSVNGSCM